MRSAIVGSVAVAASAGVVIPLTRTVKPLSDEKKDEILSVVKQSSMFTGGSDLVEHMLNEMDVDYIGEVLVGTPAQSAKKMIFDTGSGDVWFVGPTPHVKDPKVDATISRYHPADSTTGVDLGREENLHYGSGPVTLDLYKDVISLPGSDVKTSLVLGAVKDMTGLKIQEVHPIDGIVGMGFPGVSRYTEDKTQNSSVFWNQLKNDGVVDKAVFTMYLDYNKHGDAAQDKSYVAFGSPDASMVSETVSFKITQENWWAFNLDKVNGSKPAFFKKDSLTIADSGTSLTMLPIRSYISIGRKSGATFQGGAFVYPDCKIPASVATELVSFTVGGSTIKVPVSQLLYAPPKEMANGMEICMLGIMPSILLGKSAPNILGDNVLRGFVSVWDGEEKAIKFGVPPENMDKNVHIQDDVLDRIIAGYEKNLQAEEANDLAFFKDIKINGLPIKHRDLIEGDIQPMLSSEAVERF